MSVVVLTGGVGGAKLVDGLTLICAPGAVTAVINTGDDFTHLGLRISPDIDSVLYMLAGKSDLVRGWGVQDESWHFMEALSSWGGEDWFNLGDRDLAMHVLRTQALAAGASLTEFTARIAAQAEVTAHLLPMTEDGVATVLETELGTLPFQSYFVEHQCKPAVQAIGFAGAASARAAPAVLAALAAPDLEAVIVAPSNPYLSIDPILAVPGLAEAIRAAPAPVVAVSPLIGGKAVKGPTAKLMGELGIAAGNAAICAHYDGLIGGLLIDRSDSPDGLPVICAAEDTLMRTPADRARVATAALALARRCA